MRSTFARSGAFLELMMMPMALASSQSLIWKGRTPCPIPGVHHPITFANETHGFVLTGSTNNAVATSDFYIYNEAEDGWTEMSAAYQGPARSFGYGVVLPVMNSTKAYFGFGAALNGQRLSDLWELDMATLEFRQLPSLPDGHGRRHPAMNAVRKAGSSDKFEIHVGLGDTYTNGRFVNLFVNLKDFWKFDIESEKWTQLPDLPAVARHHPYYFSIGDSSYAGFGHSPFGIERDWYVLTSDSNSTADPSWTVETSMASYEVQVDDDKSTPPVFSNEPVTTEARVAGTQFAIELPLEGGESNLKGSLGFVLSGDGSDHGPMASGEFHAYYAAGNGLLDGPEGPSSSWWRQLPPHPGHSRWAPGSFVMRGTARAYFMGGYDRALKNLFSDLWMIDLSRLFLSLDEVQDEVEREIEEETSTGGNVNDTNMGGIESAALEAEAFTSASMLTSSSARFGDFITTTSAVAVVSAVLHFL